MFGKASSSVRPTIGPRETSEVISLNTLKILFILTHCCLFLRKSINALGSFYQTHMWNIWLRVDRRECNKTLLSDPFMLFLQHGYCLYVLFPSSVNRISTCCLLQFQRLQFCCITIFTYVKDKVTLHRKFIYFWKCFQKTNWSKIKNYVLVVYSFVNLCLIWEYTNGKLTFIVWEKFPKKIRS